MADSYTTIPGAGNRVLSKDFSIAEVIAWAERQRARRLADAAMVLAVYGNVSDRDRVRRRWSEEVEGTAGDRWE